MQFLGLHIAREDIKTQDGFERSPALRGQTEVEFTLYKRAEGTTAPNPQISLHKIPIFSGSRKNYGAADVTKPGGVPFEGDPG